jgi:hypothetical protein
VTSSAGVVVVETADNVEPEQTPEVAPLPIDRPAQFLAKRGLDAARESVDGQHMSFARFAAESTFTTADLMPYAAAALATGSLSLGSLRYELSKLRAKGLVEKIEHSRRYRLTRPGYRVCLIFLKLFGKLHAPLTAALIEPVAADEGLPDSKLTRLDRLYRAVTNALDSLVDEVGIKAAAYERPHHLSVEHGRHRGGLHLAAHNYVSAPRAGGVKGVFVVP